MKKQKLNCEKARYYPIVQALGKFGHFPKRKSEKEAWFLSPFRSESRASFKVSMALNRWYDHGEGRGGNVIDLVMELKRCTTSEALCFLTEEISVLSFHQQPQKKLAKEKNYRILEIKTLQHRALLGYLISRKIDTQIAIKNCTEIHYELNSKKFFAIAFKNDKNGFEIRNKYIKGNLVNKNITTIKNESKAVCIFEGFIDFLSFKTLYRNKSFSTDFIILNSISNVKNIISIINKYDKAYCYLDRDIPGINGTTILVNSHKNCIDQSYLYSGHNDFNDYLTRIPVTQQ